MTLHLSKHPLAAHQLSILRDRDTHAEAFREASTQLGRVLLVEATADLPVVPYSLTTPLTETEGQRLARPIVAVPVLRAGLGLLPAAEELLPGLRVGFVGLERDEETAKPTAYYAKFPDLRGASCVVLEPMLATGGSLSWACSELRAAGAEEIRAVCVVAAPAGVERMKNDHPDVEIYAAACDPTLDGRNFIVPGLGDMGDRLFGTD